MDASAPELSVGDAICWAVDWSLPLWANAGFDAATGLFHERLTFEREPIALPARRLMVQARQIATYSRAAIAGLYYPDFSIEACIDMMQRRYRSSDGAPGWVFSIDPDLRPFDRTRDLYAHAFVLFALAWSYKLTANPSFIAMADELCEVLDRHFLLGDGSYADALPSRESVRRQNPHMHLLEAYLAWADVAGFDRYLQRAHLLVNFARSRFVDAETGAVFEEFDAGWKPLKEFGKNRIEPGHLFEWAWLLREFERLSGDNCAEQVDGLVRHAVAFGIDNKTQLIVDCVTETGAVLADTFRCWPQTESVRTLYSRANNDGDKPLSACVSLGRVLAIFAPQHLRGGWIDRVDKNYRPLVDHMPASTLYHIFGAIFEVHRTIKV